MEWFGGTGEGQFPPGGEYQTYRVSLPKHMLRLRCPVEGRGEVLFEVFLDLQKAYGALYWDICLDILVAYRVGPSTIQLLQTYWDRLTMVSRAGG